MGKDSRRKRLRKAKQKRITEVRAMLAMGIDGEWHNTGKHVFDLEKENSVTITDTQIIRRFTESTCLCKQCVISIARDKLGLWLK